MSTSTSAPPVPPVDTPSSDEKLWAMLCHLSALAGYFVPFGNVIGPLVVWLIKKDQLPLVDDQGKEAVNFQISITLYLVISIISLFVLIGIVLVPAVLVLDIVCMIIAAIKANQGIAYRYPMTIRFIT